MVEKGDRIKFTGEGVVERISGAWADIRMNNGTMTSINLNAVEKEQVYTTFKSGDVVESFPHGHFRYTVGESGYIEHSSGRYFEFDGNFHKPFTSECYRKVNL